MIQIKEAKTKAEMKAFVTFPFELFKNSPNWIPPLISDELNTFNRAENPAFKTSDVQFLLAYKDGKLVGKTAAIVNWDEVNVLKKNKTRFGWFDVIDDIDVTKALLDAVIAFGKEKGMDHIEGPMGFSNLDKVGALTEGFDKMGNMITWYSMPYYKEHFLKLGLQIEKTYIEGDFSFSNIDPTPYRRASQLIKKRFKLRSTSFKKTSEVMPYVDKMFDLFNSSYAKLQSFVPINEEQKAYFKKKYISFINPEYIKFVLDENDKMVAFSILMPGFAQALKKANGKLFPFGFYHMLQAKKHSKEVVFYLIGVLPEYQKKGVTAIIFDEAHAICEAKGITKCVRTPELEENEAVHNLWKNFDAKVTKKRSTFIKHI